jgi:hypothetical protein
MTNNRMSMTLQDEAYLAYLLARALVEPAAPDATEPVTAGRAAAAPVTAAS